jgi:DivIVA domain-containing protein
MDLLLLLLAVGLVGVVAAVATGRVRGGLDEPARGRPDRAMPDGPLSGRDVERVRFNLALRGYRMDEVDDALDRVQQELDARDARIASLIAQLGGVLDRPAGDEVDDRVELHVPEKHLPVREKHVPVREKHVPVPEKQGASQHEPAGQGQGEQPPADATA